MLKIRGGLRTTVIQRSVSQPAVLCFSPWTLLELRDRPDLYKEFLELFAIVPFALIKHPSAILDEEIENYPNGEASPLLAIFSFVRDDDYGDPAAFLDKAFSDPTVIDAEKRWASQWKAESLSSMLKLRSNFPPGPNGYQIRDALRFVELALLQNVISADLKWAEKTIEREGDIDVSAFPSLRMILHTVFFRFYYENRDPELQDVFDILIHAAAPHVDLVLTEGFQAEVMNKVSRLDPLLEHLEGASLRQIRRW